MVAARRCRKPGTKVPNSQPRWPALQLPAAGAPNIERPGADLIAWYLGPGRVVAAIGYMPWSRIKGQPLTLKGLLVLPVFLVVIDVIHLSEHSAPHLISKGVAFFLVSGVISAFQGAARGQPPSCIPAGRSLGALPLSTVSAASSRRPPRNWLPPGLRPVRAVDGRAEGDPSDADAAKRPGPRHVAFVTPAGGAGGDHRRLPRVRRCKNCHW